MYSIQNAQAVKHHLTTASFMQGFNRDVDTINQAYDPDEPFDLTEEEKEARLEEEYERQYYIDEGFESEYLSFLI